MHAASNDARVIDPEQGQEPQDVLWLEDLLRFAEVEAHLGTKLDFHFCGFLIQSSARLRTRSLGKLLK